MRVLFSYYTHKPGGLCTRLYRLMNACAERGDEVEYLSLDDPRAHLSGKVRWIRIPLFIKRRSGLLFWGVFTLWLPCFLVWRAWRGNPDRLVAFGAYYAAAMALAARFKRVPLVLFLRSLTFEIDRITGKPGWLRLITGFVDRFGIESADTIVCMSEAMRAGVHSFVGRDSLPLVILPNDIPERRVDMASEAYLPESARSAREGGANLAIVAGVLDQRKNVMVLLEAIEILSHRQLSSHIHLLVAGEGPELERLERFSHAMKLTNVTFLGWVSQLPQLLEQVDVLLHPALHEGAPNVVLEAISAERPVLVSDIPEHTEFVQDPVARVPSAHSVEWANALGRFITDSSFRKHLTGVSRDTRMRLSFSWADAARNIIESRHI